MKLYYKSIIKPPTKYDCITMVSVANYVMKAVYSNKDGHVKSKIFSLPRKTHGN